MTRVIRRVRGARTSVPRHTSPAQQINSCCCAVETLMILAGGLVSLRRSPRYCIALLLAFSSTQQYQDPHRLSVACTAESSLNAAKGRRRGQASLCCFTFDISQSEDGQPADHPVPMQDHAGGAQSASACSRSSATSEETRLTMPINASNRPPGGSRRSHQSLRQPHLCTDERPRFASRLAGGGCKAAR